MNKENQKLIMARTIEEQTGWKRTYPTMICQDPAVLMKVSEYSFDLNNPEFREYYTKRTGQSFDPDFFNQALDFYQNWTEEEVMTRPDFTYVERQGSIRISSKRPVSEEDRIFWCKQLRVTRGALQDCWELFCMGQNIQKEKPRVDIHFEDINRPNKPEQLSLFTKYQQKEGKCEKES